MIGVIRFPHLGITLNNVAQSISIGGFEIACYGITIALAFVSALCLVRIIAGYTGQNKDDYTDLAMVTIIVSIIGARLYYVIFSWDYYSTHLTEIFNIRLGGLAIYGGVAAGAATVICFCHIRKLPWKMVLDTASVGLVWGQMVGRWGNFFNREAFGGYTDGLLAMQIPVDDLRNYRLTEEISQNIQTIKGIRYVQVHPTFLYESLWNLGILLILLYLICRKKGYFQGQIFLSYFLLYGIGRFWIEGLRTDQLLIPGTEWPVSQLLSGILVVITGSFLILKYRKERYRR